MNNSITTVDNINKEYIIDIRLILFSIVMILSIFIIIYLLIKLIRYNYIINAFNKLKLNIIGLTRRNFKLIDDVYYTDNPHQLINDIEKN
nr:hypothetical protein [Wadden Sea poxvirus]